MMEKELGNEDENISSFTKELFENPEKTGIDFQKKAYTFLSGKDKNKSFSLVFDLKNASKFSEFIEEFISLKGNQKLIIEENPTFKHIKLGRQSIGWDGEKCILTGYLEYSRRRKNGSYNNLVELFSLNKTIENNISFNEFDKKSKDINAWYSSSVMFSNPGMTKELEELASEFKDVFYMYTLDFKNGEIVAETNITLNEELKKIYEKHPTEKKFNDELLKVLPSKNYMSAGMSIDIESLFAIFKEFKFYEKFKKELGSDFDKVEPILRSLGGSVVISLFDVEKMEQISTRKRFDYYDKISGEFVYKEHTDTSEVLTPKMGFVFDVKDQKVMDKINEEISSSDIIKHELGYSEFKMGRIFPIYYASNKTMIFVTNDEGIMKTFVEGGKLEKSLAETEFKNSLSENIFYGKMLLNTVDYPSVVFEELMNGPRYIRQVIGNWNEIVYSVEFSQNDYTSGKTILKLKNKEVNSLRAIINVLDSNVPE